MNRPRLLLAALGGTLAQLAIGFLLIWLAPGILEEGHKYPAVFRPEEQMAAVMPIGMAAGFVAILIAAVIFAMIHRSGSSLAAGLRFGLLMGIFVVCAVALHDYMTLNIGLKLALEQAGSYFVQWLAIGMAIALIYKPLATT